MESSITKLPKKSQHMKGLSLIGHEKPTKRPVETTISSTACDSGILQQVPGSRCQSGRGREFSHNEIQVGFHVF